GVCERRRKPPDRRMSVDVLYRYRWQVPSLPHPRTEMGHHQRVGAQLLEEVAVDRHAVDAQDTGQHFGEDALGAKGGGAAPLLDHRRFRGHVDSSARVLRFGDSPRALRRSRRTHRTTSQKKSDRRRPWPAATAWSYTHLPTASSSS